MDTQTKEIVKPLVELAGSALSDLSSLYILVADHLLNLSDEQRSQLRDESARRLALSRQVKQSAQQL
jgi:hypothetical protein